MFKSRVRLKDVRVSWVNGELKRNGEKVTENQVVISLQNKHKQFGNLILLTQEELQDIIYKDISRYRQKLTPMDSLKVQLKKLELQAKVLEIQKIREEYRIQALEKSKKRELSELFKQELMDKSHPSEYNLEMYQRMPLEYCILAIQSTHKELTDKQAKMIIGSWIRKGY